MQVGYALAGDQFTLTTMNEVRPLVVPFALDTKHLINPGSVGQPRDGDPRAAYAFWSPDERVVEYHRVEYDIKTAQQKIIDAGLPELLAARLAIGT